MAKEPKVTTDEQAAELKGKVPPVRWNQTVNSGWYISNEMFRRMAYTGEFSPGKETAKPKAASPKAPQAA